MEGYAACDVQMLRGRHGEYVIKEFAVFKATDEGDTYQVVMFAPPCDAAELSEDIVKQNTYVSTRIHGLPWDLGEKPYKELIDTLTQLTSRFSVLYVKGLEKQRVLQSIVRTQVIDVETIGCPALKSLPLIWAPCHSKNHTSPHKYACAMRNAKRVGLWLKKEISAS